MGEAADDVLDGLVCEVCGEWMDDVLSADDAFEVPGYPRRCESCAEPRKSRQKSRRRKS